jgi:uncharacterized protein (TIGR02611 family)
LTPLELLHWVRRGVIFVVGFSVVAIGCVMIFTPGPAVIVVPAGLALLATEFAWARRLLSRLKRQIDVMRERGTPPRPPPPDVPPAQA